MYKIAIAGAGAMGGRIGISIKEAGYDVTLIDNWEEHVNQINQDAVRLIKDIYNIDMEKTQYSKSINDLPKIDIVITMGCNVTCPIIEGDYREDWGLDDPSGKSDDEFRKTIKAIENNILKLKEKLS